MGSIACSRCGSTIKLDASGKQTVTPIAVTDKKEGTRYLKFVCNDCKEFVIGRTYRQLTEEIQNESLTNANHE